MDCKISTRQTKQNKTKTKVPALRIASWNVRTMLTGLNENLEAMNDARKTAVIDRELDKLNIDIAALLETRLSENGSLKDECCTFFWQGKEAEEPCQHGVSFAIRNDLVGMIEPPTNGSDRTLTLKISIHINFSWPLSCKTAQTLHRVIAS